MKSILFKNKQLYWKIVFYIWKCIEYKYFFLIYHSIMYILILIIQTDKGIFPLRFSTSH